MGRHLPRSPSYFFRSGESAVPVTLDHNQNFCLLRLEGEIDITSATELKTLLLQGLASGRELRVDLERATDLDVTAMQLLWAAEREARKSGMGMALTGLVPEAISSAAGDAGFERFPVPRNPELAAEVSGEFRK